MLDCCDETMYPFGQTCMECTDDDESHLPPPYVTGRCAHEEKYIIGVEGLDEFRRAVWLVSLYNWKAMKKYCTMRVIRQSRKGNLDRALESISTCTCIHNPIRTDSPDPLLTIGDRLVVV